VWVCCGGGGRVEPDTGHGWSQLADTGHRDTGQPAAWWGRLQLVERWLHPTALCSTQPSTPPLCPTPPQSSTPLQSSTHEGATAERWALGWPSEHG
jgi:hypothetical protein